MTNLISDSESCSVSNRLNHLFSHRWDVLLPMSGPLKLAITVRVQLEQNDASHAKMCFLKAALDFQIQRDFASVLQS